MVKDEKHWAKSGEAGSVLGMKMLLLTYRLFGRVGFRFILYPVMTYFYLFRTEARLASKQYQKKLSAITFAQTKPESSFQHFLMFGEILLDKFLVWMGHIRKEHVVFANQAEIEAFENNRAGGVIVVSHLGNNEICSALAEHLPNIQLTLLVYTQHAEKFNSIIQTLNRDSKIDIYQVTDMTPAKAMILSERVNAGGYVVIAGDRTPVTGEGRVSKVSFMGTSASMPQGAFILAGLLKCPVYLLFCLKQQDKYHVYIELFSKRLNFPRKQRDQIINETVQSYAHRLEYYCQKAPLQWFNFFPYWG
ncbi:MAG: putative LPLAT superfamily acyltransferase, partial [Gammaproteobacteria bacterium]